MRTVLPDGCSDERSLRPIVGSRDWCVGGAHRDSFTGFLVPDTNTFSEEWVSRFPLERFDLFSTALTISKAVVSSASRRTHSEAGKNARTSAYFTFSMIITYK